MKTSLIFVMLCILSCCKHRSGNEEVSAPKSDASSTFLPPTYESMFGKKPVTPTTASEEDMCTTEFDPHRCYLSDAKGQKNPKIFWDGANQCVARQNAGHDANKEKYRSKDGTIPLLCERTEQKSE